MRREEQGNEVLPIMQCFSTPLIRTFIDWSSMGQEKKWDVVETALL